MWAQNAVAVREAGFRTIIPDFQGFGRSRGRMKSISKTARLVLHILDDLKIGQAAVCGLSMGGYVAFEIVRAEPQRVAAAVFCDTNSDMDSAEKKIERRESISTITRNGTGAVMEDLACALISQSTQRNIPSVAARIVEQFKAADETAVCAALEAMAVRRDSNDLLVKVEFPVKLIYGADDPMLPAGIRMANAISTAFLEIVPESGHFPNLENPQKFNDIILEFLKGLNFE